MVVGWVCGWCVCCVRVVYDGLCAWCGLSVVGWLVGWLVG